jgi:hypothetical protein
MMFRRTLTYAFILALGDGTNAAFISDADRYAFGGGKAFGAASVANIYPYKPDGRIIFGGMKTRRSQVLEEGIIENIGGSDRDESSSKVHRETTDTSNGAPVTIIIGGIDVRTLRDVFACNYPPFGRHFHHASLY